MKKNFNETYTVRANIIIPARTWDKFKEAVKKEYKMNNQTSHKLRELINKYLEESKKREVLLKQRS